MIVLNLVFLVLSSILLIFSAFVTSYYLFLAVVALLKPPKPWQNTETVDDPFRKFAIVVPAHNEEGAIINTLKSCREIDYPEALFEVFVIADNCSDDTAQVVENEGMKCLVRTNKELIGKGHALGWAFERVMPQGFDAVVVLDADCRIDSHALKAFNQHLGHGDLVLQANDIACNPDDSPMTYVISVGNLIENDLYYYPKSMLGMAVVLRGTGMVFSAEILQRFPWGASSIVEDMEYTMDLLRHGHSVKFVQEACVSSPFPSKQAQLDVQRTRWAAGNLGYGKSDALKFIKEGLLKGPLVLADFGWNMIVLSRPLMLAILGITLLFCALTLLLGPSIFSMFLLIAALGCCALQGLYFFLGIVLLGISKNRMLFLLQAPGVVLRLVMISVVSLVAPGKQIWKRTPREHD
jgi:cellulose synthase/poly-beta-1,6-N-acetylglucosamine synthase-like glycosyltransferase